MNVGGWTTPLSPVRPDEMWLVFDSGVFFEWICGFAIADELLNGGMTKINGQPCKVERVDEWPELCGVQIRASLVTEAQALRVAA